MPQIFFAKHNRLQASVEEILPLLSAQRAERIDRIKTPAAKLQSASASLLLETQLQKQYGLTRAQLSYARSERGKPYLKRQSPNRELSFSISHCDEWAACAIISSSEEESGCSIQIGVDIERIGRGKKNVVESRFCEEEISAMRQFEEMGQLQWQRGFTALWTAKEAEAKCLDWPLMEVISNVNLAEILTHELCSIKDTSANHGSINHANASYSVTTAITPRKFVTSTGETIYIAGLNMGEHIIHVASTSSREVSFNYCDQ